MVERCAIIVKTSNIYPVDVGIKTERWIKNEQRAGKSKKKTRARKKIRGNIKRREGLSSEKDYRARLK